MAWGVEQTPTLRQHNLTMVFVSWLANLQHKINWTSSDIYVVSSSYIPNNQSRRHGGLIPPNKALSSPKLNYEAIYIGGVFIRFQNVKSPWTNVKPPYWKLFGDGSANNWAFFCLSRSCFNQSSEIWTHPPLVVLLNSGIFLTLETAFFLHRQWLSGDASKNDWLILMSWLLWPHMF